jgi:putative endonuclease
MTSTEAGKRGEILAAGYLEGQGFEVLDRNFRSKRGEIDLVCKDGDVLVFVEVKTWKTIGAEFIARSIDRRKMERMMQTAEWYLHEHPGLESSAIRFDVVFISGRDEEMHHLKDALRRDW